VELILLSTVYGKACHGDDIAEETVDRRFLYEIATSPARIFRTASRASDRSASGLSGGETSREFGFCIAGARAGCKMGPSLGIIHYSTLSDVLSSRRPGTLRPPSAAVLFRSHFATLPSQLHPLGVSARLLKVTSTERGNGTAAVAQKLNS